MVPPLMMIGSAVFNHIDGGARDCLFLRDVARFVHGKGAACKAGERIGCERFGSAPHAAQLLGNMQSRDIPTNSGLGCACQAAQFDDGVTTGRS